MINGWLPFGGFHSHGGTPSSLDGFWKGESHRSKWMMARGTRISGNHHVIKCDNPDDDDDDDDDDDMGVWLSS